MSSAAGQTVLFIGDSITHAHRRPDELHDCYRLGCGYVNSAVGELEASGGHAHNQFLNHGECGDTVPKLLARWDRDCLRHRPDIISVLIGINDAHSPDGCIHNFRDDYHRLLDLTRKQLPSVKLILLEPFGVRVPAHPTIETISTNQLARLADLQPVVRELAVEANAVFLPLQKIFDQPPAEVWTLDGIHPSAAGHWKIARAWVAAAQAAGWLSFSKRESEST